MVQLWKRTFLSWKFSLKKEYGVAIGAEGYKTPPGVYLINSRAKCPDWLVPDSDWARDAGLVPRTIVPGCTPENPIKVRWLGITDPKGGIGLHGTADINSIGTAASHGCLRMKPEDIIELFDQVKLYTPIIII